MDIVKAFQNNDSNLHVTIQGTQEDPLFRASDIGAILDMTNIRVMTKDFDDSEKVVRNAYTPGGSQEVTFLTEKGLYKTLFRSRKPIAKQFTDWVCDVIKEIRVNGKYELEQKITDTIKSKEQNILTNFSDVPILYIGLAEDDVGKPGYTDNAGNRLKDHKKEIRPDFTFEYVYESVYNREIERRLYQNPEMKKRRFSKVYPGRKEPQTELFRLDSNFTIHDIDKIIKEIKKEVELEEYNKDKDAEINKLKLEILQLRNNNTSVSGGFKGEIEEKIEEKIEKNNKKIDSHIKNIIKEEIHDEIKDNINSQIDSQIKNTIKQQSEEITTLKNKIVHIKGDKKFIAKNILTGEEIEFKSYSDANKISGLGPHSLKDNYLDKPRQCRGYIFRTEGSKCWQPPHNFIFNENTKPSSHMIMCKSENIKTKEVNYYNSIIEAVEYINKLYPEFILDDTHRRKLNRIITEGKPTKDDVLNKYKWYMCDKDIGEFI